MTAKKAIRSAELHSELVRYKDVTIPTASVLAAYTTPYTILAAPPAGYFNIFEGARVTLDYAGVAYASVQDATIRYTDGSGQTCATLTGSGFFDATADASRYLYPVHLAAFAPVAAAVLVFVIASADIVTGTSPIKIRVFYRRVPTAL
jgi:hypothetical protein